MSAQEFLPGFDRIEDLLAGAPFNVSDEEIDVKAHERFPKITLERIEEERPDLVQMVARAFFNLGISLRNISYVTGLHRDTCSAIIAKHNATSAVKEMRKAKALAVHQLGNIAIMRLRELLMNPAAIKKAGISGVMDVVRRLDEMSDKLNEQEEQNGKVIDLSETKVKGFHSKVSICHPWVSSSNVQFSFENAFYNIF